MKRIAVEADELVRRTIDNGGVGVVFRQEEGQQALSVGTYSGAASPLT